MLQCLVAAGCCIVFNLATAQVTESVNHKAYDYLYRMSQKGVIGIDDYILPLDRETIYSLLDSVKVHDNLLTKVEKAELDFYLADFSIDKRISAKTIKFYKNDSARFRFLYALDETKSLMIDPIIGFEGGQYQNKGFYSYYGGVRLYGKLGQHVGYNFLLKDVHEIGDTFDLSKAFNRYQGRAGGILSKNDVNYSELNFNISYKWKNGMISFGKDNIIWGYGESGNIVLSSKAPSYPFIRLDYYPFKWLHFNYLHGWLSSNVIDSNSIYGIGLNNNRINYIPKYLVHHSLNVTPIKGLKISIGESIVYSDKFDFGYLIPINFFKAYDHYASNSDIRAGGNGQFFAQVSSRNHIKNTHLYANVLIDEIRLLKLFNKTNRNQLGYTIGANVADLGIKYMTVGAEYVHINPFVYSNLIAAQLYTNSSYSLGDWMGNNADRAYLFVKYTPLAKLKAKAWYQYVRKGGPGTIEQQYDETQPQPPFLFDKQFNQTEIGFNLQYEWIHTLKFNITLLNTRTDFANASSSKGSSIFAGLSYGF